MYRQYWDFFPSPNWVTEYLVELADIEEPSEPVLETSAGVGHLSRKIRRIGVPVHCVEIVPEFRAALTRQNFLVVADNFLTVRLPNYRTIVQNPPFSLQLSFVTGAYELLAPEGRLVSLLSDAPFLYNRGHYHRFRNWCKSVRAEVTELPYGLFLNSDRPTNVRCYSFVARKW
jgi:hypothetical protein